MLKRVLFYVLSENIIVTRNEYVNLLTKNAKHFNVPHLVRLWALLVRHVHRVIWMKILSVLGVHLLGEHKELTHPRERLLFRLKSKVDLVFLQDDSLMRIQMNHILPIPLLYEMQLVHLVLEEEGMAGMEMVVVILEFFMPEVLL